MVKIPTSIRRRPSSTPVVDSRTMTDQPGTPRPRRRHLGPLAAAVVTTLALALTLLATPEPAGAAGHPDSCFVDAGHRIFLDRPATTPELSLWNSRFSDGWPYHRLPQELAASDEWLGVEVAKIYRAALDRDPDPAGRAFWVDRLRRGDLVNRIASLVYGSGEFYARAGSTPDAFVTGLYQRILHRDPDPAGLDHWVDLLTTHDRARVAEQFFASRESRVDRITALYDQILGRAPDGPGLAHWVVELETVNDIRLAVLLASSGELYDRAQVGCTLSPPPTSDVAFRGRGWGHGRGMGQWGALGYAVDHGWSSRQILDHYYGGTVAGIVSGAVPRVYLVGSDGQELIVTQAAGALRVDGGGTANLAAVRVARLSPNRFRIWRGSGCGGPWSHVGDRTAGEVVIRSALPIGDNTSLMLQRCLPGRTRYYRGDLRAVEAKNTIVAVNRVGLEDLVRSVVAREMSPSWASHGGGRGMQALQAQAVAARSYAMADTRWLPYATTCDTTTCQAYEGHGHRATGSTTITRVEYPQTDQATLATTGQVRRWPDGRIVYAEFSSSTGGWTAGGQFPAVVDAGDAYAGNPHQTWTITKTRAEIERAYDARQGRDMGTFVTFDSFQRDGNGPLGGRVRSVRAVFSGGTVTLTGGQARFVIGLKSAWFAT